MPSTFIVSTYAGAFIPYTNIDFDFSNAVVFPGATATFDLTFPTQSTPEIDPSLASSGLILVAGAIAILRSRRHLTP